VVVGVAREDEVDHAIRQQRVGELAANHLDVRATLLCGALAQVLDHVVVDVDGVHASRVSDGVGEAEREVAAAGSDVRDPVARADVEQRDHLVGLLPAIAAEALVHLALEGAAADEPERGERRQRTRPHASLQGARASTR
jgi:hypothetical protein